MRHEAAGITSSRFPRGLRAARPAADSSTYHHEPGAADDGVTLTLPLTMLNQIPAARCEWLVPGLLEEKVQQLAKTLPQKIRHRLSSVSDYAADFAAREHDVDQPLLRAPAARHRGTRAA